MRPQAVPGKLSRYGLSQVINGLLELGERTICLCDTSRTAMNCCSLLFARHRTQHRRCRRCGMVVSVLFSPNICAETPRPFDFLVAGELVRQPLQQLVTTLGISAVGHPIRRQCMPLDTYRCGAAVCLTGAVHNQED